METPLYLQANAAWNEPRVDLPLPGKLNHRVAAAAHTHKGSKRPWEQARPCSIHQTSVTTSAAQ